MSASTLGREGRVLQTRVICAQPCGGSQMQKGPLGPLLRNAMRGCAGFCHVNGFLFVPSAVMPGDALLFQRLSVSTIGAVRFHGRVRDGIGWGTDAMVTKQ